MAKSLSACSGTEIGMVSPDFDKKGKSQKGSYEAQKKLAIREADELVADSEKSQNKDIFLLYSYVTQALDYAVGIAKMTRSKEGLPVEQFVAKQVRLFEYVKRIETYPNVINLLKNWPSNPGITFACLSGQNALDVSMKFAQRIFTGVIVARNEVSCHGVTSYDNLIIYHSAFKEWQIRTITELLAHEIPKPDIWPSMADIHREYQSLLYKLQDEYQRYTMKNRDTVNELEILTEKLNQIESLKSESITSEKFCLWLEKTKTVIRNIFGASSEQYKKICDVSFYAFQSYTDEEPPENEHKEAYLTGLKDVKVLIESFIEEKKYFCSDKPNGSIQSQNFNRKKLWTHISYISGILVVFTTLILNLGKIKEMFFGAKVTNPQSSTVEARTSSDFSPAIATSGPNSSVTINYPVPKSKLNHANVKICFALTDTNEIAIVGLKTKGVENFTAALLYKNISEKTVYDTTLKLIYPTHIEIRGLDNNLKSYSVGSDEHLRNVLEIPIGDIHPDELGRPIESQPELSLINVAVDIADRNFIAMPFSYRTYTDQITTFEVEVQILAEDYPLNSQKLYMKTGTSEAFKDYKNLLFTVQNGTLVKCEK